MPTPSETTLSTRIQGRWAALARTGVPDVSGALPWPRYSAAVDDALAIDGDDSVQNDFDAAGCSFWDSVQ